MDTIKEESPVLQPGKEGAEMITVGGPNDVIHSGKPCIDR